MIIKSAAGPREFFVALLLLHFAGIISPPAQGDEWQFAKEKNYVRLYYQPYPGSDVQEFKAVTVFDTDIDTIMSVLTDIEGFPRWIYQCSKALLLQELPNNDYMIYQINALPLASDRDVIMRVHIDRNEDDSEVTISLHTDAHFCDNRSDAQCETTKHTKFVRITDSVGYYQLRALGHNKVELTWQQHVDPAGKLPTWLINRTLSNLPIESLTALRKLVE